MVLLPSLCCFHLLACRAMQHFATLRSSLPANLGGDIPIVIGIAYYPSCGKNVIVELCIIKRSIGYEIIVIHKLWFFQKNSLTTFSAKESLNYSGIFVYDYLSKADAGETTKISQSLCIHIQVAKEFSMVSCTSMKCLRWTLVVSNTWDKSFRNKRTWQSSLSP